MATVFLLSIQGLTGEHQKLKRLGPGRSEGTLGVMLAPLENHQAHVGYLRDIAKTWSESIRSGHFQKHDVIPLIKTTVM